MIVNGSFRPLHETFFERILRKLVKIFQGLKLQPLHKASLQVNTDLDALAPVLDWFEQFNKPPIPAQTWMQCQLALAEGFTNAVRHAHRNQPVDLAIDVEAQVIKDRIEIRIWDHGKPFDLKQQLKDMPEELDSEAEGGRGLRLMERIADELSYTRMQDARNCLLIIKYYSSTEELP